MSVVADDKIVVLNEQQIKQKIKRIAYEVFENNFKEKNIVLAGIEGQGYLFAKLISKDLKSISPIIVTIAKVSLDKFAPEQKEIEIDIPEKEFKNRCILLVDDVLNTGRTLAFAMNPFLETGVKKIEVAVLVNRSHTQFPISPTYTGHALTTILKDQVEVVLGKNSSVYLR